MVEGAEGHEPEVLSIGHSNRTFEEFVRLLKAHGVRLVADVRTVPRSRANPQFNRESLPDALAGEGIDYVHLPALGGLRRPRPDSPNTAWRNASFRGYADYMLTPEFEEGLDRLLALAREKRTAIMCAEALPWRCHRSLLGDALLQRGIDVGDISSERPPKPHTLTRFARIEGEHIIYDIAEDDERKENGE